MRTLALFLSVILSFGFFSNDLIAQENDPVVITQENTLVQETKILFSQPFESQKLGKFTLPFGWEVVENEQEKRVIATETRALAPAVITVDFLEIGNDIDAKDVMERIAATLGSSLSSSGVPQIDAFKTEGGVKYYQTELQGTEKSGDKMIERRCALEMIPVRGNMLVFSMCADASRHYSPDLREILHQTFMLME